MMEKPDEEMTPGQAVVYNYELAAKRDNFKDHQLFFTDAATEYDYHFTRHLYTTSFAGQGQANRTYRVVAISNAQLPHGFDHQQGRNGSGLRCLKPLAQLGQLIDSGMAQAIDPADIPDSHKKAMASVER
jgi:hypothetical protein